MRLKRMIFAGLFLSACTIGPEYTYPEIDLPDRYSVLAPVTKASTSDLHWWRDFNDPVLNELVAQAMQSNIGVAEARERVREAEAVARQEGVVPTGNGTITARGNSNAGDTVSGEVTASFNLAGRTGWTSRAARQRLEAARLGVGEATRLLLAELGAAYIEMRFLQRSLETRSQDLASRQRTLRDLRTQFDVAAATQLDILRAQALVMETQAEIPRISANIMQQRNRISTLLGVPVGSVGTDLGYRGSQPHPIGTGDIGVPANLLRARPDIRIAERQYAAAVSDLGAAQAARYPSLDLSGLVTAPLSSGSWNESLVAGLTMPILSQPALAAAADAAESRSRQAYMGWREAVLEAVEQVENELSALRAAKQSVAASRKLVSLNERALMLSRELVIQGGDATVLDVIDRERSVSAARTTLARNMRDLALSYVNLRVSLGIGHEEVTVAPESVTMSESTILSDISRSTPNAP